jgi:hypothetical protein
LAEDPDYKDEQAPEPVSPRTQELEQARQAESEEEPTAESEDEEVQAKSEEEPTAESEDTAEVEGEEIQELDYDTLIEVKVKKDGKEVSENVKLKDLIDQRMLQSDYTRKTAELAQERARVNEELDVRVNQERAQYIDALETMQEAVIKLNVPEFSDLDQLAVSDPAKYVQVKSRLEKMQGLVAEIDSARHQIMEEQQRQFRTEVLPREMEKLKQVVPDIDTVKPAIMEFGESLGYSKEELGSISDHRAIHTLNRLRVAEARVAELEGKIDQKKVVASKKVVQKPKVMKSQGKQPTQRKGSESYAKLRKSGKLTDAANVFLDAIPDL